MYKFIFTFLYKCDLKFLGHSVFCILEKVASIWIHKDLIYLRIPDFYILFLYLICVEFWGAKFLML